MSIKSMDLAWMVVKDVKAAIKFYTEVVGLKVREFNEDFGWAELIGKDEKFALGLAQDSDDSPIHPGHNAVITLTVEDIEKSKNELHKKGVKFIGEILEIPGHVKMLLCQDIDGNNFQVVQVFHK